MGAYGRKALAYACVALLALLQPAMTLVMPNKLPTRISPAALHMIPYPFSMNLQKTLQNPLPPSDRESAAAEIQLASSSSSRTTKLTAMGKSGSGSGETSTRLSVEEEAALSHQVQMMVRLKNEKDKLHSKLERTPTDDEWAAIIGCSTKTLRNQIKKSQTAKSQLVTANVGMVAKIAHNYKTHGVPLADLMQEGNLGLLEAADRFDPSKGFKFCTYAAYWIRQRIMRSIASHSRVIRLPQHFNDKIFSVKKTIRLMESSLGRPPTQTEIAKRLEIPESKVALIMESSKKTLSLDLQASNSPDDHRVLGDRLVWEGEGPEEHTAANELRSDLSKSMHDFDSREKLVIGMRFGLDDGVFRTCAEVAKKAGISKERVRMIEAKAINKLRHPSRNLRLKEYFLGLFDH